MRAKWLRFALLAWWGTGCPQPPVPAPAPPPPCGDPEPLRLTVVASDRLNPGERGEPLATVVRIYELKSPGKLNDATFEAMLDQDKQTLGDELVSSKELTVNPGDHLDPGLSRGDGVTTVGVVALFRQPAGNFWRALYRLPPPDPNYCHSRKRRPPRTLEAFIDENRVEIR